MIQLVLATVPNCCLGSGSELYPNHCPSGSPRFQHIWMLNLWTLQSKSPIISQFGWLSADCPVCLSVDSNNALVFAVWLYYTVKITYSTSNDLFLHVLWFAILIILESLCFFLYGVFWPAKAVNSSVISSSNHAMHWLLKMPDWNVLTLHWHSFSWWGNVYVMYYFGWNGYDYFV